MPKYDLNSLSKQIISKDKQRKDVTILLDGKSYPTETTNIHIIKNIQYSCSNGSILIEGLFDLSKANIEEIISFQYLSINFSQELILANIQQFDNPKIIVNFKLLLDNEELIRRHIYRLKNTYKNFDTDYKSFIKFNLEEFSDVNILEMLNKIKINKSNKFEEEEKNKYEFGSSKLKHEKNNIFEINDDIDDNLEYEKDDNIDNNKDGEEGETNLFNLIQNKNEQEKEIKEEEEEKEVDKKNIYVKVKDIDNLDIENSKVKKINHRILNKYLSNNKNKEISKNLLLPTNINNLLFILETEEKNIEKIQINNVYINDDLKQLNEKYKKDIILNFLDLFIGAMHKNKNNKNIMSIDDYTLIVLSYIKNIEKKISEINKNSLKESEYKSYINRLEKISTSLKLFHILFLNCFYSNEDNDNFNYNNLYNDFFSLKIQTMRKKKLIEWCMQQEKNYLKKTDFIAINKNKRREILTKQLMSFGQIKNAIKVNKNQNLFINLDISNLNKNISNQTMTYFLKNQKGKNELYKIFISYKENEAFSDKINNSWISFLLQSLLYKEKNNEYITKSIDLIETKIKEMDNNAKPLIKGVLQLNFVLLKLYEKIIGGIKDINNIEENINMLSNNNLFSKNNSDHFCQYIILFLLTKVIHIIFPDLTELNSLYQKNYFLLMQVITEILSGNKKDNNEENKIMNLIMILKLLYISDIKSKLKQNILFEIISHQNLSSIESFWKQYNNENIALISDINKEYINGIYYLNNNNLLMAYKSLLKSKKYKFAIDTYLRYFFSLINEKKFNQINFIEVLDNLKEIYEKSPSLFNDFYLDFLKFISYNVNKEETEVEKIIDLLNKFMYEYYGKGKIIFLNENSHRFIIKTLCEILIDKNKINEDSILCGELRLNDLENLFFEDKNDLSNNVLKELIEHKNSQFYLNGK